MRLGQYSGELVATVAADRDYFDLARFEMELENLLRARVRVVSAGGVSVAAGAGAATGVADLVLLLASDRAGNVTRHRLRH